MCAPALKVIHVQGNVHKCKHPQFHKLWGTDTKNKIL